MNFVELDGVTIMQRIVAFKILFISSLDRDWNCFDSLSLGSSLMDLTIREQKKFLTL
jgi:hypothetical protein